MDQNIKEKIQARYHGAPEWLLESEGLRLTFAEMTFSQYRANDIPNAAELAFREFGYETPGEYWQNRFSEPLKIEEFVNLLANHLGKRLASDVEPDKSIFSAMELARETKQAFVLENHTIMVDPIAAAKWMLTLPLRRHLVPPTLASYLNGEVTVRNKPTLTLVEHEPRKRGRKPEKLDSVVVAMRSVVKERVLSLSDLRDSTEKELGRQFGASRETVRKARDIVLSEKVENGISDISATNDK